MSQFPNMGQPGSAPNPFAASPAAYPPPPRSRVWLWVLLGIGGTGLFVCCGCAGLMWFGWTKAMGVVESQMVTKLNGDPVAKEHLGAVKSASFDVMASGEATQKAGGKNLFVFHVQGEKGKADVHADQATDGQTFQNARLILPSGETIPLSF